ncbi:MAG: L-lactate dehydrogenase [Calditrichaceae bacterium]|nr:L-lactate dehydrogenase [Calditrichaceae bacterium]MBN2709774.1 L-lactate dehydrogenase [Calditrichaceae bacterium]RQV94968.1 MAG: L-lactate dehydrogenase [Calditrichota bacterium]
MSNLNNTSNKVLVVGAGAVGSTFCYALAQSGLANEIVLIDKNMNLARGQALDLVHGQPFFPNVDIRTGTPADYKDASVIVITAGAAQKPGETRLQLLQKNTAIMISIVDEINGQNSQAVLLIVSNPVDILTHVALKHSGWPKGRIIGSGTVLDSARLRHLLSRHCSVDVHNTHAYILGEHGDSEFAAWSMTNIAGIPIRAFCASCGRCADWKKELDDIETAVRKSAYHIIDYKGATCFGVGMALVRIVSAILRKQRSVLTVSTYLDGEFGLSGLCLSVPAIVTENGAEKIMNINLTTEEMQALNRSAEILKESMALLEHK